MNSKKWWKDVRQFISNVMHYARSTDDNYLRFLHDCRMKVELLECDAVSSGYETFGILKKLASWLWQLDVHMNHPVFTSYIEDGWNLLDEVEIYERTTVKWKN